MSAAEFVTITREQLEQAVSVGLGREMPALSLSSYRRLGPISIVLGSRGQVEILDGFHRGGGLLANDEADEFTVALVHDEDMIERLQDGSRPSVVAAANAELMESLNIDPFWPEW